LRRKPPSFAVNEEALRGKPPSFAVNQGALLIK